MRWGPLWSSKRRRLCWAGVLQPCISLLPLMAIGSASGCSELASCSARSAQQLCYQPVSVLQLAEWMAPEVLRSEGYDEHADV